MRRSGRWPQKVPRQWKSEFFSSELGSYVEAEQFGVVALLLEEGFGEIEAKRAERRRPVDPNADREARLGRIAQEELLETGRANIVVARQGACRALTGAMSARRQEDLAARNAFVGSTNDTDIRQRRLFHLPQRSDIDEGRWPQTHALQAGAQRKFELDPAHIIGPAAERVGDPSVAKEKVAVEIVVHALDARPEAANVEAAKLRAEEAIGEANGFD